MGKFFTLAVGVWIGWYVAENKAELAQRLKEYQGMADSEEPVLEAGDELQSFNGYTEDEYRLAKQEGYENGYDDGMKAGILQGRAKAETDLERDLEWIDRMFRKHFPERAALFVAPSNQNPGL